MGVGAIGLVAVLGVTVGVTALIMVLAVMEEFEIDLREKILGRTRTLWSCISTDILTTTKERKRPSRASMVSHRPIHLHQGHDSGRFGHDGRGKGLDVKRPKA